MVRNIFVRKGIHTKMFSTCHFTGFYHSKNLYYKFLAQRIFCSGNIKDTLQESWRWGLPRNARIVFKEDRELLQCKPCPGRLSTFSYQQKLGKKNQTFVAQKSTIDS